MIKVYAEGLQKKYKSKKVLTNVNLQLEGEKIIGLIGRNGVGKSTLLKLIAGQTAKTAGDLKTFDHDAFDDLFVAANTIYIHPEMTFPPNFTLKTICETAQQFYPFWNQTLAEQLINYFGMPYKATITQLSTGMRQQFFTIFGLATRCALTILDEPVNGLDDANRKDMYRAILKDYMEVPRMIILSSHLLDEMEHLLEEVIILHNGEVVEHQNVMDLSEKYAWMMGENASLEQGIGAIQKHPLKGQKRLVEVAKVNPETPLQAASLKDIYLILTNEREGEIDDIFSTEFQ